MLAMHVFSNKIKAPGWNSPGANITDDPSLSGSSAVESIYDFVATHGALQKAAHQSGDLGAVRLQRKVPGIE